MHEKKRYGKLGHEEDGYRPVVTRAALVLGLASALLLPALARAETIPDSQGASDSSLAVAPDGSPRVAFTTADGSLQLAVRDADGNWAEQAIAGLPGPRPLIVGLAVTPAGAADVLLEDQGGHWLGLAEQQAAGWRVRIVARSPSDGLLGFGGLALDAAGRPLVAYVYERASHKTWLRLVHEGSTGRLIGEPVTRDGFPKSDALPTVTPVVLPNGAVRVIEAYDVAAIEWARTKDRGDWVGQYLYGNSIGTPMGIVGAGASGAAVWSAWTELFPQYDESQLLLTLHRNGERTAILHHHAFLVSLRLTPAGPEVAADDYVDLLGARTVYAGLVFDPNGGALELAGDLEGYALDASGWRQYLLLDDTGLGWYRSPAPPCVRVTFSAAVSGGSFALSGRVDGAAAGGSVELWRETQTGADLATTVPLAADGSFSYLDSPPTRPLTYRAVYRDPVTGVPLASLVRTVLGA
jgi:hypothetical protein